MASEQLRVRGAAASPEGPHGRRPGLRPPGRDVDHARHRRAAVEVGQATGGHLDRLDLELGDAVPVDPVPEGVVVGDAVDQHERAAGPAGAHSPQRDALCRGVRDQAARAAEEAEARDLLERVVHGRRRPALQILPRQHREVRRAVAELPLAAGGGDGHGLGERKEGERHPEAGDGAGSHFHGPLPPAKALELHAQPVGTRRRRSGEAEAAVHVRGASARSSRPDRRGRPPPLARRRS